MAYIIMLIVTIICLVLIIYNLVKDGPIINVFLAVTQSIILFLKRYLWINQSWKDALKHSFDLLTLMVVFVYLIYKIYKRNKKNE